VLKSLPTQYLKRSKLFTDVLSVKEFSGWLFVQVLQIEFDVLYNVGVDNILPKN
jgi:hypothetical protein